MGQVVQWYVRAMPPKDIRADCEYCSVNDLANQNVPQPLKAYLDGLMMSMEDERRDAMNSELKGNLPMI